MFNICINCLYTYESTFFLTKQKNVNYWRSDDSVHNQLSEDSISRLLHDPNIFAVFFCLLAFFFFLQHSLFPSTFSLFWILKYLKIWKSEIFMFHPLERYSKIWKKFCLVEDLKVNIITCNNLFKKPNVVFCTELDLQYLKTQISVSCYGILSHCQGS